MMSKYADNDANTTQEKGQTSDFMEENYRKIMGNRGLQETDCESKMR